VATPMARICLVACMYARTRVGPEPLADNGYVHEGFIPRGRQCPASACP
jgi:hypothetical protein